MVDAGELHELFEDRPDLESAVETLLDAEEPWTFDDVDVDSGVFGELVSRDVVREVDGGYRLVDRSTVVGTLAGEIPEESEESRLGSWPSVERPDLTVDQVELGAVVGLLGLVVAVRSVPFLSIFRGDRVVLSGNDPYYYRFLVEQMLAVPSTSFFVIPETVRRGEPLFVATLYWISKLFGGTPETLGQVLAWYPVASAVLTGILVYGGAVAVSQDRRVALASLALFAIIPGHALRTSLGFADHHAFDYLWLVLTLLAVTLVVKIFHGEGDRSPLKTVITVGAVAFGVAGQTLSWEAGPLLLVALGLYLVVDPLLAVAGDRSSAETGLPIVFGVGVAAIVTWFIHRSFGWHTSLVASAPIWLFVGSLGSVCAGELVDRLELGPLTLTAVQTTGVGVAGYILISRFPETWQRIVKNLDERLFRVDSIAETGGLFGQSFGWLLLFGFIFILALPMLFASLRRVRERPHLLPVVVYTWYFVALAAVQVRFVGQLAPFVAIFAGFGFVRLALWVDILDVSADFRSGASHAVNIETLPDRRTIQSLVVLFLLVGSLSFVQIPIKIDQLTYSDTQYETATWIDEYADQQGLNYPKNYVFSQWGNSRFYNYFVSGESKSYQYALERYRNSVTGTEPEIYYDAFEGRVGFIVLTPNAVGDQRSLGSRLYKAHGSRTDSLPGLSHYRLVHVSEDGSYKVFSVVPGAILEGSGPPNSTVIVTLNTTVSSRSVTYERAAKTGTGGNFKITVPYPGRYKFGNQSVRITEDAVRNGTTISAR